MHSNDERRKTNDERRYERRTTNPTNYERTNNEILRTTNDERRTYERSELRTTNDEIRTYER